MCSSDTLRHCPANTIVYALLLSAHWSDRLGRRKLAREDVKLPSKEWCWISEWTVDMNRDTDKAGWSYGKSYADLETKRPGGHGCVAVVWCGDTQCVRSCSPAQPKLQAK